MDTHDAVTIGRHVTEASVKVASVNGEVVAAALRIRERDEEVGQALLGLSVMVTELSVCLAQLSRLLVHDAIAQSTSIPDAPL